MNIRRTSWGFARVVSGEAWPSSALTNRITEVWLVVGVVSLLTIIF